MPVLAAAAAAVFSAVTTFATAVGTAALASAGLGSLATMGIASFTGSLTIGTLVGAISIGSTAMSLFSAMKKPKAGAGGASPIAFKADPNAYIPFVAGGPVGVGGNQVFAQTAGSKNRWLQYTTVLSHGGPIQQASPLKANDETVPFTLYDGQGASGRYQNRLWQRIGLGAIGAAATIITASGTKYPPLPNGGQPPEWNASSKLSAMGHSVMSMWADPEKIPQIPKPTWEVIGGPVYDPRKDSTYPGGVGPQRWNDRSTWSLVGNRNPYLHALSFVIGHTYNGVRAGGVGVPISGIDVPAFVNGANVADANSWTIAWQWHTGMRKWDVLATMLQAGAGVPLVRGSKVSCMVDTPRVSIGQITDADLRGSFSVTGSASIRDRKNAIIPRCKSAAHKWSVQPHGVVTSAVYVAEDRGEERPVEVEYEAIADPAQVRQIAALELANLREGLGGSIPVSTAFLKYRAGDCLTVNAGSTLMTGQKVVVVTRAFDPKTRIVTLTVRSETDGKHAWALGQIAAPPPSPSLVGADPTIIQPPTPGAWQAEPGQVPGGGAGPGQPDMPVIVVTPTVPTEPDGTGGGGTIDDEPAATNVVVRYRRVGVDPATMGPYPWSQQEFPGRSDRLELTGLAPGTTYEVELAYRVRGIVSDFTPYGLVTTGSLLASDTLTVGGTPSADLLADLAYVEDLTAALELAASNANAAIALLDDRVDAVDFDLNDPATGLKVRVGSVETVAAKAASRVGVVEVRAGSLESAAASLLPASLNGGTRLFTTDFPSLNAVPLDAPTGYADGVGAYWPSTVAGGWIAQRGTLPLLPGHTYEVEYQRRMVSDIAQYDGKTRQYFGLACFDGSGAYVGGNVYLGSAMHNTASGWVHDRARISTPTILSYFPTAVSARAIALTNYRDEGFTSGGVTWVARLGLSDVTAEAEIPLLSARTASLELATLNLELGKADATRVAVVEAQVSGVGYANTNANLSNWPDEESMPTGWLVYGAGPTREAGPGVMNTYVSRFNAPGTTNYGMFTDVPGLTAGWHAVTTEIELLAGQYSGIGVLFRPKDAAGNELGYPFEGYSSNFPEDGDTTMTPVGAGIVGRTYRQTFLIDASHPDVYAAMVAARVYLMVDGYFNYFAKDVKVRLVGVRRATAAEVEQRQARGGFASLAARSVSTETAVANLALGKADASRVVLIEARAGGANLLTRSQFFGPSMSPWYVANNSMYSNAAGVWTTNNGWAPPGEYPLFAIAGTDIGILDFLYDYVPMQAGKRYCFSVYFARAFNTVGGTGRCFMEFQDDAGNVLGYSSGADNTNSKGGGPSLNDYERLAAFGVAPAGTTRARLYMRMANDWGPGAYTWFLRPMVSEATPTQTEPPPWASAAVESRVTVSEQATADLYGRTQARWQIGAAVPGATAFIQALAETTPGAAPTSSVAIGAQQFAVFNPTAADWKKALEVVNGNVLLTGGLQAGAFIRLGNGQGWPVALKAVDFSLTDGEVVAFGTDLGALPSLSFGLNNLAPLATGETYNVYAESLTATGFTLRAKISIPAAPTDQSVTTGDVAVTISGNNGRKLARGALPDTADGTFRVVADGSQGATIYGTGGGAAIADNEVYVSTYLTVYALKGGVWTVAATTQVETVFDPDDYPEGPNGAFAFWNLDEVFTVGTGATEIAVVATGSSNGVGAIVNDLSGIYWQSAGTGSGIRTATPSGQKTRVTVRPQ